jgi:hypothetical protein
MTDDMLSKLATAICSKSCICKDEGIIPVFERCVRRKEAAIAMLAVLSSPTEGMLEAATRDLAFEGYNQRRDGDAVYVRLVWAAMLSHVLNERPR